MPGRRRRSWSALAPDPRVIVVVDTQGEPFAWIEVDRDEDGGVMLQLDMAARTVFDREDAALLRAALVDAAGS